MPAMIFVNLPVRDLPATMAYYKALGFDHNPQFTDETAASIVISDTIFVMALTYDKFRQFSSNPNSGCAFPDWSPLCVDPRQPRRCRCHR